MADIRHPLGLPEGSVRGLLALQICLQYWLLLLLPETQRVPVPLYLYFLLSLVMLFFVTRSRVESSTNEVNDLRPLWISGTLFRLFLLGTTVGVIGFKYYNEGEDFLKFLTPKPAQLTDWPAFGISLLVGFTIGFFLRLLPVRNSYIVQTAQAWVSILAMSLLVMDLVYQTFIAPGMQQRLGTVGWECLLTGIIAFYFSSRS